MKIFVTGAGTSAQLSSSMPFGRATLLVKDVKDVALMLPKEKLGAAPREAMCAVRPQ
jgi:hypothetical protein